MIQREKILDMSDVCLGNLTEYRLLVMLGTYHSLCLVDGLNISPDEIVDSNNRILYPAYYMTKLTVPVTNFIGSFGLWDKVKLSVDVSRFGSNILDSKYKFERAVLPEEADEQGILMESNSLFVVDATLDKSVNRTVSIPKADKIAKLDKLVKPPVSLNTFKSVRKNGFAPGSQAVMVPTFYYKICTNRDVSPNHGVIFAKFIEIMDMAESEFLCSKLKMPEQVMEYLNVVERETYYYSNCFANEVIEVDMSIDFQECENRNLTCKRQEVTPYWVYTTYELYTQNTRNLVAISKAKKVICLPVEGLNYEMDINRSITKRFK